MNKILAFGGFLLILVTGAAAVGLLDSGGSAAPASAAAVAGGSRAHVPIMNFAFVPKTLHVNVGAKVTWTNEDSAPHTATADNGTTFDTGTLMQHQSKTITFPTAGTFTYHCSFHAFMTATITVG